MLHHTLKNLSRLYDKTTSFSSPNHVFVFDLSKEKEGVSRSWNRLCCDRVFMFMYEVESETNLDYWNKKITVKATKMLIIQLFFVYPMSIWIHFSQHSNYCLMAVANSSAAIVVVTPTLRRSLWVCLCPGRAPHLFLHPPEQKEIRRSKAWWPVECQRCSML
jgi:hypothetical protein